MKTREEQIQEIVGSFPQFKNKDLTFHRNGRFSISETKEDKKRRRYNGTYSIRDVLTKQGVKKALLTHK